jgi:hypothetical protein
MTSCNWGVWASILPWYVRQLKVGNSLEFLLSRVTISSQLALGLIVGRGIVIV